MSQSRQSLTSEIHHSWCGWRVILWFLKRRCFLHTGDKKGSFEKKGRVKGCVTQLWCDVGHAHKLPVHCRFTLQLCTKFNGQTIMWSIGVFSRVGLFDAGAELWLPGGQVDWQVGSERVCCNVKLDTHSLMHTETHRVCVVLFLAEKFWETV